MDNPSEINRRDFLKATALTLIGGAAYSADANQANTDNPMNPNDNKNHSPVRLEAKRWSELPTVLKAYEKLIDEGDGTHRLFGYASLIKNHTNEKPASSKDIPDEKAQLNGMEVAMNVLAAGEYEFRGTRGKYTNAEGKEKDFANVGVYAGLEQAPGGYAQGLTITVNAQDRRESLMAYIKRELGEPPAGIALKDLFDDSAATKFEKLKTTSGDNFGMYKFQVVDVGIAKGKVPAVTVSTNEESKFSAIGHTPMQTAHLILDGQGYNRKVKDSRSGGAALDYFKQNVIGVAHELKLQQPRLEAIDAAVEELAAVYAKASDIVAQKLPVLDEHKAFQALIKEHPDVIGVASPRFGKGDNVNKRDAVSEEDKALPENQMPHTAEEKFIRIAKLQAAGATKQSR